MVKVCHPDRHALDEGRRVRAEETLKRVVRAYECLRNGVPPSAPREPKKAAAETPGSSFSVRQAAATGRRRSAAQSRSGAGNWGWHVAVWLPAVAGLSALFASLSAGPSPPVRISEPVPYALDTWVFPEVRHRERAWDILNPTERTWSDCTAWVGAKWLSFKVLKPREEIRLQVKDFYGAPGPLDASLQLEIACLRR